MRNNNNKVQKKYCLTSIVRVSSEARLGCKKYGLTLYFSSHGRMFSSAQQRKSALDNRKKQTGKALPRTRRGLVSLRLTFCYSYLYVFTYRQISVTYAWIQIKEVGISGAYSYNIQFYCTSIIHPIMSNVRVYFNIELALTTWCSFIMICFISAI